MTTYASAPELPAIIEFQTDDPRDVMPTVRHWMEEGRTVVYDGRHKDGTHTQFLINFAALPALTVSTRDPRNGEDDPRVGLPITLDQLQMKPFMLKS